MNEPTRDPGKALKEVLRREVNFGCPVRHPDGSGCGCPILTYHHFDPPWAGNFVHDIDGMIALCDTHHRQADGGRWTKEQLREMKRNPFIDNALKVPWPYDPETLVIKAGTCFIVGSGSPLRLHGRPVMMFRPAKIEALGRRIVTFESDIVDSLGQPWLKISDGWFDASIPQTANLEFTPQLKRFVAKNRDSSQISLTFKRKPLNDFEKWLLGFVRVSKEAARKGKTSRDICRQILDSVTKLKAIDSDECVPLMEIHGTLQTPETKIRITHRDLRIDLDPSVTGKADGGSVGPLTVDETRRLSFRYDPSRHGGAEFLSIG